jgi:hypothetical protein
MELARAIEIVEALKDGYNPYNGIVFERDSVFQQADPVRALHLAVSAMKSRLRHQERKAKLPENAGKLWTEEETKRLCASFDQGVNVIDLAKEHGRTQGSIRSKLVQLGKIQY